MNNPVERTVKDSPLCLDKKDMKLRLLRILVPKHNQNIIITIIIIIIIIMIIIIIVIVIMTIIS